MLVLMRDPRLRTRVLRLIDVLAALPERGGDRLAARLIREYLRPLLPELPLWQRVPIAAATDRAIPHRVLAGATRYGMRFVARRFIVEPGGAGIDEVVDDLCSLGRYSSLDLLGEAVLSDEEALDYQRQYLRLLGQLGRHPLAAQRTPGNAACLEVSVKLSALTSQFNPADPIGTAARVRPLLEEIFDAARLTGVGVTVDAEQYVYRDLAWHVLRETLESGAAFHDWPDAGIAVQAYLRDAGAHVRELAAFTERRGTPLRVRLVKGAYWDQEIIQAEQLGWPVPVYRAKDDTDRSFESLARFVMHEAPGISLAVASHNVRAHAYAEAVREARGLPMSFVEHQTLFRTLDGLSRALPQVGWVARDYVPVGELVPGMAYLVRRILENTSQVGFLTQERLDQSPERLLQPPQHRPEDSSYRRRAYHTGFLNDPSARFFDREERRRFQGALDAVSPLGSQNAVQVHLRLGGKQVNGLDPAPSYSPSHPGVVVAWVHEAGIEETERAIALANKAVAAWAEQPCARRAAIGLRAAELLRRRRDEAAAWVVHEGGRNWTEAMADVEEAIDHIDWNARQLQRLGPLADAAFRPRGVVACIPPWNFPLALPAGMASAALLAGNTVILKPAEQTAATARLLVEAFHDAGVPVDALIHLPGRGETVGARLVESPDVDMVAFTGSKAVGMEVYRRTAEVLPTRGGIKKAVTEMGGKNAIVVFPDADMDEAVEGIVSSAFAHAGQKCSACSRVLVHEDVYPRLRERLVRAARSLPLGPSDDPATVINPVIDDEARRRVLGHVETVRREGRVLLDRIAAGRDNPNLLGPLVYELSPGDLPASTTAREEIFGPVLALIPFSSERQALAIANDVPYGLTFGVFSRSPRTISRAVHAAQAGNVYVNRKITASRVGIEPFGGRKLSGTGPKTGSDEYLFAFMTRREGYRQTADTPRLSTQPSAPVPPELAGVEGPPLPSPWWQHGAAKRASVLRSTLDALANAGPDLSPGMPPGALGAALAAIRAVVDAAAEVTAPQTVVEVPGQDNMVLWETPLGIGLVAVDQGGDPAVLAGYLFGSLLAGNGVVVAVPETWKPLAGLLLTALRAAGLPAGVVALAPPGTSLESIAARQLHFAAVDLDVTSTRALNRVLCETREDRGQRWLKLLIHAAEGLHPGEPAFLRQFAHPKAVSIRTLRHGADLELF